jgi:hypothetical protein
MEKSPAFHLRRGYSLIITKFPTVTKQIEVINDPITNDEVLRG